MERQREYARCTADVGFAASAAGEGSAFVAVRRDGGEPRLRRVSFRCRPLPALRGRDVAYAAVTAVAAELLRAGLRSVELRVDDAFLAADLGERRALPAALTLPYVTLGCILNRFRRAVVVAGGKQAAELGRRARAESNRSAAA